jgi:predicted nucleic acid-binding protein
MSAADSFFVDTNILLYSINATEPGKQRQARLWVDAVWSAKTGRISWQVIHEFYSNAVGKLGVSAKVARAAVEELVLWNPEPPMHATIQRAWQWCDSARINFWDALIVAAAEQSGCRWLLSEDFQAGRKFGSLTVVNPFERTPDDFGTG